MCSLQVAILWLSGPLLFSPLQASEVLFFSRCTYSLSHFLFAPSHVSLCLFLQRPRSLCGAFCLLLCFINTNWIRFFSTFLFTSSFRLRDLCATFLFTSSSCLRALLTPLLTWLPANGLSVLAAAWLVAVQSAPAMPLVKRVLGFDAELTGSQSWLEAADVVKRGV